jgi:hypothetical protein
VVPATVGCTCRPQTVTAVDQCCNGHVTLSDADVAALARQAVDRRDPELDIRIVPADPVDPYRWGTAAWSVSAGGASSYITADMTADAALAKLNSDLGPPPDSPRE